MLAILVAFYRRPEITAVVFAHYQRIADARLDVTLVAVGSEGDESKALAESHGWIYVEAPNDPLSDKLAAGLARCRELRPTGVLCMGSDDLVTESWIERCMKEPEAIGLLDMHLLRVGVWDAVYWGGYEGARAGESVGAHRYFPAALLDALDWQLWPLGLNRNLDAGLTQRLKDVGYRIATMSTDAAGCNALGLSSESNLTPWDLVVMGSVPVTPTEALAGFPPETVRDVMALRVGADPVEEYVARVRSDPHLQPLVSLVMIAKDAERTILRAIRPCLPFIDEIVCVVDSRTTDGTIEKLKELDATVVVEDWRGFAWARNRAAECARGRWHLLIDATDVVEVGNLAEAIQVADDEDSDAVWGTVLTSSIPGQYVPMRQVRVLRAGRAKWAGYRHNELVGVKKVTDSTAIFNHSYRGRLRGIALAAIPELLAMYESPSDPAWTPAQEKAHAAVFLARSYLALDAWTDVRLWATRALEHTEAGSDKATMARCCEAWAILMQDGHVAADAYCRQYDKEAGETADFAYIIGTTWMMLFCVRSMAPGRNAAIPQNSLAFAHVAEKALSLMGVGVSVRLEHPPEVAAEVAT